MAVSLYKALRLIAMHDVLKEPPEFHLRRVFRWYSKTFSTPLTEVEKLPLEDVLQHFYESKYEDMEPDDRDRERQALIESPEDAAKRMNQEAYEQFQDLEFEKFAETQAQKDTKRLEEEAKQKVKDGKPITPLKRARTLPESSLDSSFDGGDVVPGPISMTFISAAEMEEQLESGGIGGGEEDDPQTSNLDTKLPPKF